MLNTHAQFFNRACFYKPASCGTTPSPKFRLLASSEKQQQKYNNKLIYVEDDVNDFHPARFGAVRDVGLGTGAVFMLQADGTLVNESELALKLHISSCGLASYCSMMRMLVMLTEV